MRKKPITRDEVRVEGGDMYPRIVTLPVGAVRIRGSDLETIPRLWAPLVRELNRMATEWAESPDGVKFSQWCAENGSVGPQLAATPVPTSVSGRCRHCGRRFYRARDGDRPSWQLRTGLYCSDRCQRAATEPARKRRRAAFITARAEKRAAAREDLECQRCGKPLKAQRSTARFCSVRCRVAAHRRA